MTKERDTNTNAEPNDNFGTDGGDDWDNALASDEVLQRLRRARPVETGELPSGTDPGPQALLKEILMSTPTIDQASATDTRTAPHSNGAPPAPSSDDSVVSWGPQRSNRRRFTLMAGAAAAAVAVVGASIVIQGGQSSTSRVHAAADNSVLIDSGRVEWLVTVDGLLGLDAIDTNGDVEPFTFSGTTRFSGEDSATQVQPFGEGSPLVETIVVDGDTYTTGLGGGWIAAPVLDAEPVGYRPSAVLADLSRLDGYTRTGTGSIGGVEVEKFTVSASGDDLEGSSMSAFAVVPDTDIAVWGVDRVAYEVWIDDDQLVRRLVGTGTAPDGSITTVASFSEYGEPQEIAAPTDVQEIDTEGMRLIELMAATPEGLADRCFPDVQLLAELSDAAFGQLVECLDAGGATEAAALLAELGGDGADAALESVVGPLGGDD